LRITKSPARPSRIVPAVRNLGGWLAVAALWAFGVALFLTLSWFVLWLSGRLMSLSGRGRRRG